MRRALSVIVVMSVLVGVACGMSGEDHTMATPPATASSPELRIARFDVAEAGWGDAPVGVHFLWSVESTTGRPLTCDLDLDGDGTLDQRIEGCRPNTIDDPIETLPARTYTIPGAHLPKLVVSDGIHTVQATQEIYANKVTFAKTTLLPETLPGFVKAEAVPNTSVVLTFASEAEVPNVNVGDTLWGTSGFGYLIKATDIRRTGTTLTVHGVQGKLNEAIEDGFIGARDVTPSYDDVRCLDANCEASTIEKLGVQPARPPMLTPKSLGVGRAPLRLETSGNLGVKISLPNGGEPFEHSIFVGFRIKKFVLDVSAFTVNELTFDVVPGFNYDLAFKGSILEKKIQLGTFTLGTIPIGPVAIVPIVFPTLTFGANVKFSGSIGFDIPVHAKYTPATGVDLDFTAQRRGLAREILDPIGSGASFEAEAKLSFPVKALAWGVAGPYVGPVMGLTGELRIGTPQVTNNPCNGLVETCVSARASFGGEYGLGCPWIEAIEVKREITALELELYKKCSGRDALDPDKCADAGSDGGPNDGDAAPPACVPTGTVSGPPTGSPSGSVSCAGSEVLWSGSNLGTGTCWSLGDRTFPSVPGSGERAVIPNDIPPGAYTLTVQAAGGSVSAPFTITSDSCPGADAGTDAGKDGGGLEVTVGGVYDVVRSGATTNFKGYVIGDATPPAQAETSAAIAASRLTAPGIAIGSCGAPTVPTLLDPVSGVGAGTLSLSQDGAPLGTVPSKPSGAGGVEYAGLLASLPADTSLDLTLAGSPSFPGVTLAGGVRTSPPLLVTSPDLAQGQQLVPAGDLPIAFTPTQAAHMTITVQQLGGGVAQVCKVDPSVGSFTIPSAILGAAGTTTSLTIRMGYVVETIASGRRHVAIADSTLNGLVSLQ